MAKQLLFQDVEVGAAVPTLIKNPNSQQLVKWAGASGDYYQIHYDKDFAITKNLPGIIVHGRLKSAFLVQMLTDWIGVDGELRKFTCSYRGMDYPDQTMTCKGAVTKKYTEGKDNCVECDIWAENPKGEKTTIGTALVLLPSKA